MSKVVIIDDEPWTREVIKELGNWEELGLEIAGEASDGEFALEIIRQTNPDIILTDVKMPHMDGIQLVSTLRSENNRSLVIFISGYDDYVYIRSALKLEAVDYLLKPLKEEELNKQLTACVALLSEREVPVESKSLERGFLETSWSGKYYKLRDDLCDALNSLDTEVIKQKCDLIYELIILNEGNMPAKSIMVCLYYNLMYTLEHFLVSRVDNSKKILCEKNLTFVFSRDSSVEELIDHIKQLCISIAFSIRENNRNRNRLDIDKIRTYIQDHYTEGITLEHTATIFYVSKEYLSKVFRIETGKGFLEYLTMLRMERARELITDYKVPIKEVGELVGYIDQAHFYKTFKKYHGKTPGEIRSLIIDNK